MKKSIQLLSVEMESSSGLTPQFKEFYSTFKKELTKFLTDKGCTKIEVGKGHFYVSGFFTNASGQIYYFSLSDVRGMHYRGSKEMLYRTATHYKDFTGGGNNYIDLNRLENWVSVF